MLGRPLARIAGALVAMGIAGIGAWSWATHWRPSPVRYPLQGIDLGENPPPVEWGTVRARGADFAYLVATSGADRRDAAFEDNWAALPEAGLRRGAVLVYSLCQPAIAQANAFNAFVPRTADALPVAIDIAFHADCLERPERAKLIADLGALIAMIEGHSGKPAMLRVAKPVESDYTLTADLHRPIWEMANGVAPNYAQRPWTMWRASDIRRIDGIEGPVNWDVVRP